MSQQPPNQWGHNPYEQPQQGHPTQPVGAQPQWGQPGGGQGQQWGNQAPQGAYGQQQWGQGPGGPGGPYGPGGPGGAGGSGGNKKTIWLVLVAVLVLVAAAVVVAILVFTGDDDDDDKSDSKGDESSSTTPSESSSQSESPSESPTEVTSEPTDPTTSASTETSAPVEDGEALFVFPAEVDGRTLDASKAPQGGKVGPDEGYVSAAYEGSSMGDLVMYQYMKSLDAKSYAEATDNPVKQVGDIYCAKVLESLDAFACAVDFKDGVLITSSNMTTVNGHEEVAATLQAMVEAIG